MQKARSGDDRPTRSPHSVSPNDLALPPLWDGEHLQAQALRAHRGTPVIELIASEWYLTAIIALNLGFTFGFAGGILVARREARDGEHPELYAPRKDKTGSF